MAAGRLSAQQAVEHRNRTQVTAKLEWDEEEQQRLLAPVWRFLEYLPSNFVATEVGSRVQSFDVKRSYTMPVRQANLQIDDTCHEKLFRLAQAENVEQLTEADKQLNLLKPDAETGAELLSAFGRCQQSLP